MRVGLRALRTLAIAAALAAAVNAPALGQPVPAAAAAMTPHVQVTATRLPEDVLDVPASVTVVSGSELEARNVRDLAGALALAGGVSVAPGGDGGPASSVPEMMGLREFDAFLLVVDGVPWGGAFNPALPTLTLVNVDRIEVLRGSAPVLFGATSFVGVIQVIHRSPESTPHAAMTWLGSHGSGGVALTLPLGEAGALDQSLSAGVERAGLADARAGFDRAHGLWSATHEGANGDRLRLAVDLTAVRQGPASPHPRVGRTLSPLVPLDANHNPGDAAIDEDRLHFVVGYERRLAAADWTTTLALTHTRRDTVRGFLRADFDVPADESNADGFRQEFSGDDLYFDTHLAWKPAPTLSWIAGVDMLAGRGRADSENFEYHVNADGSGAPSSRDLRIDERPSLEDERDFAGAYVQALWKPGPRWLIDAGLRANHTRERQTGQVQAGDPGAPEGEDGPVTHDSRTDSRLSGGIGASFRAWGAGGDAVWVFADYRDAFKPAAVDFGPEAEGEILDPETAQTIEGGLKGTHFGGRLGWQLSAFQMDFDNLVVAATIDGLPTLENAGQQRFKGVEFEGQYQLAADLVLQGAYARHSARFRDYVVEFDGVPTQLGGKQLEMSADMLASLGLTWSPARGWNGYVLAARVGDRYLNKRNTAPADPYNTLAAGLGYRFARSEVRLDVDNLTDERPPVAESELGDAQYYRLPARSLRLSASWNF